MSGTHHSFAGQHEYAQVDQATDPAVYVRHLDTVTGLTAVQAYKHETYTLLGIREGSRVLDVGCGAGDDVRAMSELVGQTGRVVGVDNSETMIVAARERAQGSNLPAEFLLGNVYQLEWGEASFDCVRADRVLHHLDEPERALAEMVRVTRPGGRVAVFEPDFDSLIIDSPDLAMARRVVNEIAARYRQPACGRQLQRWFKASGLVDVIALPKPFIFDYATFETLFGVERAAQAEAGDRWLEQVKQAVTAGLFLGVGIGFIACGRKP